MARVADALRRVVNDRVDDEEDDKEEDDEDAEEGPRDALKVDDEVRDEEAHEAKDRAGGADEQRARLLKCRAHEVGADACTEADRLAVPQLRLGFDRASSGAGGLKRAQVGSQHMHLMHACPSVRMAPDG